MISSNSLPQETARLFHTIRDHGLDTVPRIKLLMNWVELDPADKTIINELNDCVNEEIRLQQVIPDPFRKTAPRDSNHFQGELELGTIPHHGHSFSAKIESINKHWLDLGQTGGGKTTVIRNALLQTLQQPDPPKTMIIERKQEYTELLSACPDMLVLNSKHLAFNPLRPPKGFKAADWVAIFTVRLTPILGPLA